MRALSWSVVLLSLLPAVACGGDGLTLPGPGDPATLTILAGDGQRGPLGEALAEPLVVQLVDGEGLPVSGRDVVFRFTDELPDAAVDPGSALTDTAGQATVRARLGRQEGSQAIEALVAVPGEDLRVRFRLTAMPVDEGGPPPTGGNGGNGSGDDGGGTVGGGGGGGGGGGDSDDGGGGSDEEGGGSGGGHGHGKGGNGGGNGNGDD